MDGIRNDSFRKKNGQDERAPRSKSRDHVTCHRCLCQGHSASECTAPAPVPRSASKGPPRNGDRGSRRPSWDGNREESGDRNRGTSAGSRPSRDGNRRETPYGSRDSSRGSSDRSRHQHNHMVHFSSSNGVSSDDEDDQESVSFEDMLEQASAQSDI